MRLYIGIFVSGVTLVALIVLGIYLFMPGFLGSEQFWQSISIEALSFVFTTAAIGSVSAAVIRYMDEQRSKPVRAYISRMVIRDVNAALANYSMSLVAGYFLSSSIRHSVLIGDAEPKAYGITDGPTYMNLLKDSATGFRKAVEKLDRMIMIYPVEMHDDIAVARDTFNRTAEVCDTVIDLLEGGSYRNSYGSLFQPHMTPWQPTHNALTLLAKFSDSEDSKLIYDLSDPENILTQLLKHEIRNLLRGAYQCDTAQAAINHSIPDCRPQGLIDMARYHDMPDQMFNIGGRVPSGLVPVPDGCYSIIELIELCNEAEFEVILEHCPSSRKSFLHEYEMRKARAPMKGT